MAVPPIPLFIGLASLGYSITYCVSYKMIVGSYNILKLLTILMILSMLHTGFFYLYLY